MSVDVTALVQLLRDEPAQREALRAVLLGDRADPDATMRRLAEHMAELAHAQARTEQRLDELAKDVRELALAQQRTEASLKDLVDVVSGMNDRLARADGYLLEQRFRDRGHAYFSSIARRLRLVEGNQLAVMVDDAQQAGTITGTEADAILLADAVFSGLRREDRAPVHLVLEASVTIGRRDVRRARERADLLASVVSTPVLAVVAGEHVPVPVAQAAHDADVWRVTNGRAVAPGEAEPDD